MLYNEEDSADIKIGAFSLWVKAGPDREDWLQVSAATNRFLQIRNQQLAIAR